MSDSKNDFARDVDEWHEANGAKNPQGKRRRGSGFGSSFVDQTLIIAGIALAAVAAMTFIGGAAVDKGNEIADKISEESNPSTGEVIPESADTKAEPQHSLDLSMAWPILGIAGGGAGTVLIGALSVGAIKRSRRASIEHAALAEARAEDRRRALAVWQKYADNHEALKDKVLEIETDWDMLFSYPTLADSSVPQTREFYRALRAADGASPEPPAELNLAMDISEFHYPKLVASAQNAWDAAWSFAKLTGTKLIPRAERKKVDQIVKLLKLARNSGGSEHERSVAYDRASKLIGELQFVRVPEAALKAIGVEARLMIEAPVETQFAESRVTEKVAIAL